MALVKENDDMHGHARDICSFEGLASEEVASLK